MVGTGLQKGVEDPTPADPLTHPPYGKGRGIIDKLDPIYIHIRFNVPILSYIRAI
jgi:hypothetical protein